MMAAGPLDEGDIGTRCDHAKTGSLELLLNHPIDDAAMFHRRNAVTWANDAIGSDLAFRIDTDFP